ncbi:hypothetical protein RRG08_029768 [Elysia crispata]|uniref:Uncharacterized protein n=1 Tax=Elysia crispata TaxID=231223 RepID=A0AAE1B6V0_9GAST|nr:hypothetical protein RRG08_029768 [Elysia crispata]
MEMETRIKEPMMSCKRHKSKERSIFLCLSIRHPSHAIRFVTVTPRDGSTHHRSKGSIRGVNHLGVTGQQVCQGIAQYQQQFSFESIRGFLAEWSEKWFSAFQWYGPKGYFTTGVVYNIKDYRWVEATVSCCEGSMLTRYRLCVSACSEGDHLHNPRWFAGGGEDSFIPMVLVSRVSGRCYLLHSTPTYTLSRSIDWRGHGNRFSSSPSRPCPPFLSPFRDKACDIIPCDPLQTAIIVPVTFTAVPPLAQRPLPVRVTFNIGRVHFEGHAVAGRGGQGPLDPRV